MKWIENFMSNQFLFYSFLAILCIGSIILFTLIYMDRKNIKLFKNEEKNWIKELEDAEEEVKITQIHEEEEKPKANLEEVLEKMQADLDKKEDVAAIFEQEQEEKAIISYQELLQSKNKTSTASNKELLSVIEKIESGSKEKPKDDSFEDFFTEPISAIPEEEPKRFKTTDFISPVYGKIDNQIHYPKIPNFNELNQTGTSLEQRLDLETSEMDHNDAFLNALKEFRSHLE